MSAPTPEQVRQWAANVTKRTRAAQGLPPQIEDPEVIDQIAALIEPAAVPAPTASRDAA